MHLKKLHLVGFKSFANETTLEFGPGITAVVGPNGSGKSNIVDAMLWALGERSARALRGSNATDVIFNGTASKKPTGRAEVNLFFDNQSGVLPIGFKEVQVTRKLFRDGAGEYGLCGSKCRLRDILDLFLDTGVGPDAGCIISQGEIDAILSARPEDRRGLIEGAAGIQRYHSRRTETKKHLEKVVSDLTRVGDIIAELESQIEPLREQAGIAREYDALALRLKSLQWQILARDYLGRKERLQTLEAARQTGAQKVRKMRVGIENRDRLESITGRELRELEASSEALSTELTALVSRSKGVEGQIAVARERRRSLSEQQEFGALEIGQLRAKSQGLSEQIKAQKTELLRAQNQNSGLNQNAALAEARLGGAVSRLSESARELQLLQSKVIETLRRGQGGRERLAGARAEIDSIQLRAAEIEKLLQTGHEEAETLGQLRASAEQVLAQLREKIADVSALEGARQEVESAREKLASAQKNAAELRESRARAQSRALVLRELEDSLEGFAGGTKAVLQAAHNGVLAPEYTPVADAVKAPPHLELAIETALGGNLNNLICPDNASARRAVELLKNQRAGRATFLPLAAMRASFLGERTREILRDGAVLGVANELVQCEPQNEVAVDHLLSRFIVVETLDDAIRLSKRCENGARLVSLSGEVVIPAGSITGGAGKARSNGLLARKRELEEFEVKINALDAQIEVAQGHILRTRETITAAEEGLKNALEAQAEVRALLARQERELETLIRDQNKNKGQREAVESQVRNLKNSLAAKNQALENGEKTALQAEIEARALEGAVEAARLVVNQKQAEKDAIAAEVAEVRAQFGAGQERQNSTRSAIEQLDRALQDAQTQIHARLAQLERAQSEDKSLLLGEAELLSSVGQLRARLEQVESQLQSTREARTVALEKLGQVARELKSWRESLHLNEEELHRTEVRVAATEAEISDMERRLRDEFGFIKQQNETSAIEHDTARENEESSEEETPNQGATNWNLAAIETGVEFNRRAALAEIEDLSRKIGTLGSVNLGAVTQFEAVSERLDFLLEQKTDLDTARDELDAIIAEIDGRIRAQFTATFEAIREAFAWVFERVFGGGKTHLSLTQPENLLETGVELRVQMPGKAAQDIGLLSGGERALTALSFMMAILKVRPVPFVILDEVDAPLDQSNVGRFTDLLREFTATTQFIVITHNNGTMQAADVLYGVTQQETGVSTLMSVKLTDGEGFQSARREREKQETIAN